MSMFGCWPPWLQDTMNILGLKFLRLVPHPFHKRGTQKNVLGYPILSSIITLHGGVVVVNQKLNTGINYVCISNPFLARVMLTHKPYCYNLTQMLKLENTRCKVTCSVQRVVNNVFSP